MGDFKSPATFRSLINEVFHDCIDKFMCLYIDDYSVFRESEGDHFRHLDIDMQRQKEHKLCVSPKTYKFFRDEI